nr:hypothetical protein [Pseudomonas cavernae]
MPLAAVHRVAVRLDVEAKAKVRDAATATGVVGLPLERQHIEGTRPLNLDLLGVAVVLTNTEYLGVEIGRLLRVMHREADMRKTLSFYHGRLRRGVFGA